MHPRKVIQSVEIEGGAIELVNGGLKIANADAVNRATKDYVAENKTRIAKYLRGDYDDHKAKIDNANEKLVDFMTHYDVDTHDAIDAFLRADAEVIELVIKRMQLMYNKGWQVVESTSNYEDDETDKLAAEIYRRAIEYGKNKKQKGMKAC